MPCATTPIPQPSIRQMGQTSRPKSSNSDCAGAGSPNWPSPERRLEVFPANTPWVVPVVGDGEPPFEDGRWEGRP